MKDAAAVLRPKYSVRPSGVNAGAESWAAPEIPPGEKTVGLAAGGGCAAEIARMTAKIKDHLQ